MSTPKKVTEITVDGVTYWTVSRVLAELGISRSTFTAYVSRGQAPEAILQVEGTRLWDAEEVRTWQAGRRSQR